MSGLNTGPFGYALAAIDARGALHLLKQTASGALARLRDPLKPAEGVALLGTISPVMWEVGTTLHVAVATTNQVYVWTETWPDAASSKWLALGTPAFNTLANAPIAGLALVTWNNRSKLVALRDKLLSTIDAAASTPGDWDKTPVEDGTTNTKIGIQSIVQVRHTTLATIPTRFLALSDAAKLYDVKDATAASPLLLDVAADVRPCGLEGSTDLEVAAVNSAHTKLLAQQASHLPQLPIELPNSTPRSISSAIRISAAETKTDM